MSVVFQFLLKLVAVGQAGQRIEVGLVPDDVFRVFAFRDVANIGAEFLQVR